MCDCKLGYNVCKKIAIKKKEREKKKRGSDKG